MDLKQEQYKLQEDSIVKIEKKLQESLNTKSSQKRKQESLFTKNYLLPIANEINIMRKENFPNVLGNILKDPAYTQEFFTLIQEYKMLFSQYSALDKNLTKGKIPDYLLEDIAKTIAYSILEKTNNNTINNKENIFYQKFLEFLAPMLKNIDTTIKTYKLRQKQSLALLTIFLSDEQIALIAFKSIMLLNLHQTDDEDKTKPNTEQNIIKTIAEHIFYETAYTLKKSYLILMQELSNEHLLEFASEIFIVFESYNILQKEEKQQHSTLDFYLLSSKFQKDVKKIYENILQFSPPFFEPMVIPPKPWSSINKGGYLQDETTSLRFRLNIQKTTTQKDREKLYKNQENFSSKLLESINIIQATPWSINQKILQGVSSIFIDYNQTQKEFQLKEKETKQQRKQFNKNMKELKKKIDDISVKYSGKKESVKDLIKDKQEQKEHINKYIKEQKEETKELWKEFFNLKQKKENLTKDLEDKLNKLHIQKTIIELAQKFSKYETIYFTWQVDFRGRAYPVQALLNPQGESLSKALLTFSKKKKIDTNGLKWLKIHGANNYGVDKVSFTERIQWIEEHQEKIQKTAHLNNPLEDEWLCQADKPFEFLAFCYEYDSYLADPKNFESSLPVAVDGSNNGFQHITALLHDTQGAKKVNVLPNDTNTPADIYKEVALQTKELLEKALISDEKLQIFTEELKIILPIINRSFVKKGVMTDSYGAGKSTKAQQLEPKLQELQIKSSLVKPLSKVIAKYLDKAIDIIAPSSAIYKNWINKIGKDISKQKKEIIWHTPFINFEVRQYQYKTIQKRIVTNFNGIKNTIQIIEETDDIDVKKQSQGIAPNFIHSLDATHMYMTILTCDFKGIKSFATVHDSFATHASDVEILVTTLKEEFIKLTNYDVLKHFQEEIEKRYNIKVKDITKQYIDNDFKIEDIKKSSYFFA